MSVYGGPLLCASLNVTKCLRCETTLVRWIVDEVRTWLSADWGIPLVSRASEFKMEPGQSRGSTKCFTSNCRSVFVRKTQTQGWVHDGITESNVSIPVGEILGWGRMHRTFTYPLRCIVPWAVYQRRVLCGGIPPPLPASFPLFLKRRVSEQAKVVDTRFGVKRRLRNIQDDLQRKWPIVSAQFIALSTHVQPYPQVVSC